MRATGRMHQTTVRFDRELWEALEAECARLGVSAAQFLREAAIARLSYTAGRRHEGVYADALASALDLEHRLDAGVGHSQRAGVGEQVRLEAARVTSQSVEDGLAADAVVAESKLARWRAERLRDEARTVRARVDRNPSAGAR